MARRPRVHFPGALYHVIARGNRGQDIFRDDQDHYLYLKYIREYKERFHFYLHAYVLMVNHLHLLIEVGDVQLSRIMQVLQFRYTRRYNLKYGLEGHLFQGRYKAILCDKDSYLMQLSAYIHLNPVRAGIVKDPSEYPWSSYRSYITRDRVSLADRNFVLSLFEGKKTSVQRVYELFVKDHLQEGHREDLYRTVDQRFQGDHEYVKSARGVLEERGATRHKIGLEYLASAASEVLALDRPVLYSATRNRKGALGRAVVGYIGRRLCGYENKEVAAHFNMDPSALSHGIKKVEQRIREDGSFAKRIKKLEEKLHSE
jgi:REP-associated tyrosine transposase